VTRTAVPAAPTAALRKESQSGLAYPNPTRRKMKLNPQTRLRKRNWSRVVQDHDGEGTRGVDPGSG
jgi:hypothetical protein